MPQEIPKKTKKRLWALYGKVRAAQRQGLSYNAINEAIQYKTKGKYKGITQLEQALGIHRAEEIAAQGGPRGLGERAEVAKATMANIANQATFGFADELGAAVAGAVSDDPLTGPATLERLRAQQNTGAQLPGHFAGTIAGAMIPATAGAAMAPPGLMNATKLTQLLAGTGAGAGAGAATGAGMAEQDRAGSAVRGGIWGAGAGLAGTGAGLALGGIFGRYLGGPAGGVRRRAVGELGETLSQESEEGATAVLRKAADDLPPGSRPSDISSATAEELRNIKNATPGVEDLPEYQSLVRRHHQTSQRVGQSLREAAEIPEGLPQNKIFREKIKTWREGLLRPMLERGARIDVPGLKELAQQNRMVSRALRGRGISVDDLDNPVELEKAWGALQRLRRWARAKNMDSDLRDLAIQGGDTLDGLIQAADGTFATVQQTYAQIQRVNRAYKAGYKHAGGRGSRALEEAWEGAQGNLEARESLRHGVMDWIEDGLEATSTGGGQVTQMGYEVKRMLDRLRIVFNGNDRAMNEWLEKNIRGQEFRWRRTYERATGNSTTVKQGKGALDVIRRVWNSGRWIRGTLRELTTLVSGNRGRMTDQMREYARLMLADLGDPELVEQIITELDILAAQSAGAQGAGVGAGGLWGRRGQPKKQPRQSIFDPGL